MIMSEYKILPSQVLIVPGYTNEEILAMSAKTKDSSASAIKNATSSTDKTTKKDDTKETTTSNTTKSSSTKASSSTQTKAKSRMLKASKPQPKSVNELYEKIKSSSVGLKGIHFKNSKSTSTNTTKNKKSSTTKSTSKTKTTKKTSKASKKKKTTSKTTKSKAGSSQKNSKSSSKNKVNESSAAVATESQVKVEKPKALLFSPESVDYTPHRKDYEEFNSADGLIIIEKSCDQFA